MEQQQIRKHRKTKQPEEQEPEAKDLRNDQLGEEVTRMVVRIEEEIDE